MKKLNIINFLSIIFSILNISSTSIAKDFFVRLTDKNETRSELPVLLEHIQKQTGLTISSNDLIKAEDIDLANSHFTMWVQTLKSIPIKGKVLRLWTEKSKKSEPKLIQFEAHVSDESSTVFSLPYLEQKNLTRRLALNAIQELQKDHNEHQIIKITTQDFWQNQNLIRQIKIFGKRGFFLVDIALQNLKIISSFYRNYPQNDLMNVPAKAFLIWEEAEGDPSIKTQPVPIVLKYLNSTLKRFSSDDPFSNLNQQRFLDDLFDPIKALDPAQQAQGYWSIPLLRNKIQKELGDLPESWNFFGNEGLLLHGRYASISIEPTAFSQFNEIHLPKNFAPLGFLNWQPTPENAEKYEVKVKAPYFGKSFFSAEEIKNIEIYRHPEHNPVYYINNGFDQIQVYFAINQMFESLWSMGFTDPELSTRKFNAILYNPDIEMRNNAFYIDDTINFTTYSGQAQNYARDNTTIWHELGHGIMDRLMGNQLSLADTGGLSEGMADFVAQMVINHVTEAQDFPGKQKLRIINNTGFFLTNEEHDDGEAYGGALYNMMQTSYEHFGMNGIAKISDLTLEAMRLCRNHPALTAQIWFSQMLFADERGSQIRAPFELHDIIISSLNSRNFSFNNELPAELLVSFDDELMVQNGKGTRYNPIKLKLAEPESKSFKMKVQIKNSSYYQFQFPVQLKIQFTGGPLQGAVHWADEEKGAQVFTLNSESDRAEFDLSTIGKCDQINTGSGGCKDFAYIQIFQTSDLKKSDKIQKPQAKKRFYVQIR